jgi:NhaA family Na+:H+ antiporter
MAHRSGTRYKGGCMAHHRLVAGRVADDRAAARVTRPIRRFMELEIASGLVLMAAVAVAIVWANSPWGDGYKAFWAMPVSVTLGPFALASTLHHAVDDGLMVLFFFVVGLEVKRELVRGALRTPRDAAIPIGAALGGMLVPAALYLALNPSGEAARGWGVPMATDIALALGVLVLAGPVPERLRVLLLGLAIIDDIGAVLVIAVFYTQHIDPVALAAAGALLGVIVGLRALDVWWTPLYAVVGTGVWLCVYLSGVHATMAGVILGLLTPVGPLRSTEPGSPPAAPDDEVPPFEAGLLRMRTLARTPVADRLMHALHPWTAFLVVPIFALANAGVALDGAALARAAASPAALGVVLGLVAGKVVGITGGCWIAVRLGAGLPAEIGWRQLAGIGLLGGIGFTMSIFVAGLAFRADMLADAKVAILIASGAAGAAGLFLLRGPRA